MVQENYIALDDFQNLWTNKCKPWIQDVHKYKDIYIGVAASSSTVIANNYHHDSITIGRPIAINNANGYLWIIMLSEYTPVATMGGMEIPISQDGTTTIDSKIYKVWKSTNSYNGTFNIYLL